jgi:hypothetical protein
MIFINKKQMNQYIITEDQLKLIKKNVLIGKKNDNVINEAWYNNVMDIVGIVDPTPITDTINAISYFSQGDTLFGILSLVAAAPFFVGDFVAKPVMGAMKIGSKETKALESALKLAKTDSKAAGEMIARLSKEPGPVGKFLQSAGGTGGWANKVNDFLKEMPSGPFKGMKNTIMDYFTLLGRAGNKSKMVGGLAKSLEADLKAGKAGVQEIKIFKDLIKSEKIFDVASLSKPGFMSQTFFGGIPRLFRSAEGRRVKIMMQQTKWWLGFLDYIGIGNWVGASEVIKKLGGEGEMLRAMENYQKTPEAKKYFNESFKEGQEIVPKAVDNVKQSVSSENVEGDPLAKFFRGLFTGQLNPIPGM